jgi:predicted RecB family nuclease
LREPIERLAGTLNATMTTRISASQLYSHMTCPHRVVLDATGDASLRDAVSPFVKMLWERGTTHEKDVMQACGQAYLDLSALHGEAKEAATREAIARREPLIYSGRLSVHEMVGEPDLLRWEEGGYVAIDIKSGAGRSDADEGDDGKPRKDYGVQLALYHDILTHMGLAVGRHGYIWDIHKHETRYDFDIPLGPRSPCLWEVYLKARAQLLRNLGSPGESRPALSSVCKQCVWRSHCFQHLKESRDLTLIPGLGRSRREALIEEFPTVAELAAAQLESYADGEKSPFPGVKMPMLRRFHARAVLQQSTNPQPFFSQSVELPRADTEIFFDIETDSMRDRCYLHGFVIRERGAKGDSEFFEGIFASEASDTAERDAFASAMTLLRHYPDALIVYYSKYERTYYRKLARRYPDVASAEEIEGLFEPGRALDLLGDVVRPATEWPTHDYSIKSIAKCCGFQWRDVDPSGAASIEWYEQWLTTGDARHRQRLLDYNEDDCRAMRVVLDRLREMLALPS